MSGNHNMYAGGEKPSELDLVQMRSWRKNWNGSWRNRMLDLIKAGNDAGALAILCHDIHTQAFMDGFAAKLSGVKDE